jgi:hypothetical protein
VVVVPFIHQRAARGYFIEIESLRKTSRESDRAGCAAKTVTYRDSSGRGRTGAASGRAGGTRTLQCWQSCACSPAVRAAEGRAGLGPTLPSHHRRRTLRARAPPGRWWLRSGNCSTTPKDAGAIPATSMLLRISLTWRGCRIWRREASTPKQPHGLPGDQ